MPREQEGDGVCRSYDPVTHLPMTNPYNRCALREFGHGGEEPHGIHEIS